jgi:ATP-dependent DNA helicase DinG
MMNLRELFGAGGALQRSLTGFIPRAGQRRLAERIAESLALREALLIEAGTGTGKTFAYLVPALLSGLRVVISTGTRPLQDQLYGRDLPLLGAALGRPVKVALLKGRANYLCRARLQTAQQDWVPGRGGALRAKIQAWAEATRSGDLAEVAELGESHPLRSELTSTRESCTGARCAEFSRCHVFAARRAALEAEIVVVNHHLLLADLALKEEGFGDLLPSADALILDEAHQLPELAAEVFGIEASSRQIEMLLQDVRRNLGPVPSGGDGSETALGELQSSLQETMLSLGRAERRVAWQDLAEASQRCCAALGPALVHLAEALPAGDAELEACSARARSLAHAISTVTDSSGELGARTLSVHARGFGLSLLPYDISARFSAMVRQRPAAWIFCSATLALSGDFSHFAGRLGLGDAATLCVDSPFDYERQALLYLPPGLPDPADPGYTDAVVECALPLLEAAGGGAFLLFTSHRALGLAARRLRDATSLAMLVQGEAPRERLLERFRASGRSVLLGTASFWEGVDVQGAALRLVLIDKLPFAAMDDPQLRARVEYIKSQGGNPFRDYQLPEAALALKQGVGRLIRSESDRGVVVICDPRLTQRGYGRTLIAALPPMRVTRERPEVMALLQECQAEFGTPAVAERLA